MTLKGGSYLLNVLEGRIKASDISTREFLSGETNTLLVLTPVTLPGWSIIATSSHSRRKTVWWLTCRCLFQQPTSTEVKLLKYLTVGDDSEIHDLVDFATSTTPLAQKRSAGNLLNIHFRELSERFLHSFQPKLKCFRIWTEIKRIPPKRFVGIGYKDQGSLGIGPSWKDQILFEPEKIPVLDRIGFILQLVRSHPSSGGVKSDPRAGAE